MVCKWCNREVQDNMQFCSYCGGNLNNNLYANNTLGAKEDKVNVGLAILSWFIPLVGLIMFFVKKSDSPKTAKACGLCALISFVLSIVMVVGSIFLLMANVESYVNETWNSSQIYNDYDSIFDDDYDIDIDTDIGSVDDEDLSDVKVSNDWKKYEISINGTVLSLPTDYDELSRLTGFTIKTSYLNSYLNSGYYSVVNMYLNDKLALSTEFMNDTDNNLLYTDCKITRISQTKYQVSNGATVIVFPGGLKAGDDITEDRIVELFGEPNDTSEYYESKTYKYYESSIFTTVNNYEIKVVNGVIDELQLDNRY